MAAESTRRADSARNWRALAARGLGAGAAIESGGRADGAAFPAPGSVWLKAATNMRWVMMLDVFMVFRGWLTTGWPPV